MNGKLGEEETEEARLEWLIEKTSSLLATHGGGRYVELGEAEAVCLMVREMGDIGGERVYEQLTQLMMKIPNWTIMRDAADALRKMGRSEEAALLIVREYAKLKPNKKGYSGFGPMCKGRQDNYIGALGKLRERCALPLLTSILEEYVVEKRYTNRASSVIGSLGAIGDFETFELIIRASVSIHHECYGTVSGALFRMSGDPRAIPLLEEALKSARIYSWRRTQMLERLLERIRKKQKEPG